MYRLTDDNPTDNLRTSMNLFYVRDGNVFVRGGGAAPDYADISLNDFIRKATRAISPEMLLPESDEEIGFAMAEYLLDGSEEPTGLIALLYTAAWAYAELRGRLKQYEDTGLTPEQVHEMYGEYCLLESALKNYGAHERMKGLAKADKEGRVVVLPCKVGDTVWFKTYKNSARECIGIQPHEVTRISVDIIVPGEFVDIGIPVEQIGDRVFLSKAEAAAADAESPDGSPILDV